MKINRRALLASGAAVAVSPLLAEQSPAQTIAPHQMPKGGVILTAVMKVKPGEEEAVKEALMAIVEPTRKEEGCLCYNLHQCKTDKAQFMFYEQWASQEALDRHSKSPHLQAMAEKTKGKTVQGQGGLTFYELLL